jgi:hypothetical protein
VKRESYRISKRSSIWGKERTLCYNVLSCLSDKVSMQLQTRRWVEVVGPNKGVGFFFLINDRIHYETKKTYCRGSRLQRHPKNSCLANKESTHKYSPNISFVALCTILISLDLIQNTLLYATCNAWCRWYFRAILKEAKLILYKKRI